MKKKEQTKILYVRLPVAIHASCKSKAALAGQTITTWITRKIEEAAK